MQRRRNGSIEDFALTRNKEKQTGGLIQVQMDTSSVPVDHVIPVLT